jgi:hypothetical protein
METFLCPRCFNPKPAMTPTPLEAAQETCRKIAGNIAKIMHGQAGVPAATKLMEARALRAGLRVSAVSDSMEARA